MSQAHNANTVVGHDGLTDAVRFMESVSRYCDALIFFDDASDDGTREVIGSFGDRIEIQILSNAENRRNLQWMNRARSLEHARRLEADWVLTLKMDEVLEPIAERGGLAAAIESSQSDSLAFVRRHLWWSDRYMRVDGDWSADLSTRAFRLTDDMRYPTVEGRSSLVPSLVAPASLCKLAIVHYGFSTEEGLCRHRENYELMAPEEIERISEPLHLSCTPSRLLRDEEFFGPTLVEVLPDRSRRAP
jgi:glycosyltransferase involved in cell wall biosynthesis